MQALARAASRQQLAAAEHQAAPLASLLASLQQLLQGGGAARQLHSSPATHARGGARVARPSPAAAARLEEDGDEPSVMRLPADLEAFARLHNPSLHSVMMAHRQLQK